MALLEFLPLRGTDRGYAFCSSLAVGDTLTVPTRMVSGSLVEGNIAQCKTVMSNDTKFGIEDSPIVPGEFALSAIDGANAVSRALLLSTS